MTDEPVDLSKPTFEVIDTPVTTDPIIPDQEASNGIPPVDETTSRYDNIRKLFDAKGTTPKPPKTTKPVPPKPRPGTLVKPLTDLYTSVGTMLIPFDQPCGMAIVNCAEDCARALENLARENPAVRRALLRLVETSVWGQVIAAHAPIFVTVAMHHNPAVRSAYAGQQAAEGAEQYLRDQHHE